MKALPDDRAVMGTADASERGSSEHGLSQTAAPRPRAPSGRLCSTAEDSVNGRLRCTQKGTVCRFPCSPY